MFKANAIGPSRPWGTALLAALAVFIVFTAVPRQADAASRLERRAQHALQCATYMGTIWNVNVTKFVERQRYYYFKGSYINRAAQAGRHSRLKGYFDGYTDKVTRGIKGMRWREKGAVAGWKKGTISKICLIRANKAVN